MSIESLKQQARKHEQNEEWAKALDQYNKALAELARDEQVDIGLYNRVGDLYVREGDLDAAVDHYDKAVDLYREAYLPNNAIAVCKKIIRNVPDRHRAYLVIGQIRAEQGFIPDARTNFLTYAERMAQAGDLDESFRALIEFADLAPEDVGVRLTVAEQMIASQRETDAVEQLKLIRSQYLKLGNQSDADDIESRILNLDPEADLSAVGVTGPGDVDLEGDIGGDFGEISFGGSELTSGSEEEVSFAVGGDDSAATTLQDASEEAASDSSVADEAEVEIDAGLGGFEIGTSDDGGGDDEVTVEIPMMELDTDEDAGEPLPMMDMGDDDASEADPLPTMDFGADDETEAEPLPMMEVDLDEEPAAGLPTIELASQSFEEAAEEAASEVAEQRHDELAATLPDALEPLEPTMVEPPVEAPVLEQPVVSGLDQVELTPIADQPEDASFASELEVAEAGPEPVQAPEAQIVEAAPVLEQAPALDEVPAPEEAPAAEAAPAEAPASDGGFVDLGAMILGDSVEKSTRFTVAYEEPSGDEEADFARMLSQFKDKVTENLDASDVRAHYDLGTAYKEMGLLDEAITSFQAALRASADHLPTYELMGQTFMEMGQPEAAVKSLERAVEAANTVEDELVGIYYYLGRAYEELQNRESAVEYYDRVFALDINFADVTERLRELR